MFSHVTIGTRDLPRAEAFYDAALAPLGILRVPGKFEGWASWQRPGEAEKLWVGKPHERRTGESRQWLDGRAHSTIPRCGGRSLRCRACRRRHG